jgi:hypothetical protein
VRVRLVRQHLSKIMVAASALLASAALIVALLALHEARNTRPTYGEVGATSVAQLGGAMTPDDVRALLGTPATIIRDNPRALCWAYHSPYEVHLCFGPKRHLAWWASNVPHPRTASYSRTDTAIAVPSGQASP